MGKWDFTRFGFKMSFGSIYHITQGPRYARKCILNICKQSGHFIQTVVLTLLVLKPEYSRMTKSIPWLLMTWFLALPGYQHPFFARWTVMYLSQGNITTTFSNAVLINDINANIFLCITYWGWEKMAAISQMTFSNAFSWMKMFKFRLELHWSLFPRV